MATRNELRPFPGPDSCALLSLFSMFLRCQHITWILLSVCLRNHSYIKTFFPVCYFIISISINNTKSQMRKPTDVICWYGIYWHRFNIGSGVIYYLVLSVLNVIISAHASTDGGYCAFYQALHLAESPRGHTDWSRKFAINYIITSSTNTDQFSIFFHWKWFQDSTTPLYYLVKYINVSFWMLHKVT